MSTSMADYFNMIPSDGDPVTFISGVAKIVRKFKLTDSVTGTHSSGCPSVSDEVKETLLGKKLTSQQWK